MLTITVTPEGEHYVIHEVHENGKITDGEYRAKFDGGEYQQTSIPPRLLATVLRTTSRSRSCSTASKK